MLWQTACLRELEAVSLRDASVALFILYAGQMVHNPVGFTIEA